MSTEAIVPDEVVDDRRRQAALLRAVGLDKVPPEQREIAIAIAKKYELDLLLKHLVLVEGRPFITRDGLLWIAHRAGVLDGIEVTEPEIVTLPGRGRVLALPRARLAQGHVRGRSSTPGATRPRAATSRYAPEMAVKVAESMALRRAFNVSAPTVDERWDLATVQADVDAVSTPRQPPRTLAERVAERRASMGPSSASGPAGPPPDEDDEITQASGVRRMEDEAALRAAQEEGRRQIERIQGAATSTADLVEGLEDELVCGDEDVSPMALGICDLPPEHKGFHHSDNGTWPRAVMRLGTDRRQLLRPPQGHTTLGAAPRCRGRRAVPSSRSRGATAT